MIELRDYQEDLVTRTGQALRRSRRVLLVLPPGGGKTVIAAFIAQRFNNQGARSYFNCHRQELIRQTSGTFSNCGLIHAFVAACYPMHLEALSQVCSIDTLKRRLEAIPEPRVVLWDECHHIGAAGWAAIMAAWPNAYHIGLTGTPQRLDGTGLGLFFDEMVLGPSPAELIAMGSLSPYSIFAPDNPDMKKVRKQMGDFAKGEAADKMREPKIIGNILKHWKKHVNGLRTVGYAVNVAHSQYMASLFNSAGIPSAHLDGGSDNGERQRVIQAYADGELKVLWNVGLFGEGFDMAAWAGKPVTIDAAILGNPTTSLSKYLQESMRPMRPAPGKVAIIMDHAGNSGRHGFPDDERDWELTWEEGVKSKGAKDGAPPPPFTCTCFRQIRRPLPPKCPYCEAVLYEADGGKIEEGEGELREQTEADKAATRARLRQEQAECKTLGELANLGRKRKYSHPLKWAQHVMANRRKSA